jgi:pimeloyl-ACP methyl ester carboxylesterase
MVLNLNRINAAISNPRKFRIMPPAMNAPNPYDSFTYCGFQFRYALRGDGIPVLFIQGVGLHGDGWLPQTNALAHHCLCLTFNNRGIDLPPLSATGQTRPATPLPFGAPITIQQMAADTLALMDSQNWPSAHLVGHSLGGLVAIHIALAHRQRVRSLSLLCTFADGRTAVKLTPRMFWLGLRSHIGPRTARRNAFLQIVMPPDFLKSADKAALAKSLEPLFGHDLADHPPIVGPQLEALRNYNATPRLHELADIPTLILSAAHDPISRPKDAGRILAQKIPGARHQEFPDASHGLPIHFADRVNALLLEHIQQAQSSRTPAQA